MIQGIYNLSNVVTDDIIRFDFFWFDERCIKHGSLRVERVNMERGVNAFGNRNHPGVQKRLYV